MNEITRVCKACGRDKPLTAYYRASQAASYYSHDCRACRSTHKRSQYNSDPQYRALQVMYSIETLIKRKYPEAWTGSLAAAGAAHLLSATHCTYCGTPNNGTWTFSLDHHVPLALGGTHSLDNLRPCCEPCNRAKHDMPPAIFTQWMAELIQRHS